MAFKSDSCSSARTFYFLSSVVSSFNSPVSSLKFEKECSRKGWNSRMGKKECFHYNNVKLPNVFNFGLGSLERSGGFV